MEPQAWLWLASELRSPSRETSGAKQQAQTERWTGLTNDQRLGFFNISGAIDDLKLSLNGWVVDWPPFDPMNPNAEQPSPIEQDRVFMRVNTAGATDLRKQARASGKFSPDMFAVFKQHGDYSDSYRQTVLHKSLQLSFMHKKVKGKLDKTTDGKAVDADIDSFNPNLKGGYGIGAIIHLFQVAIHKIGKIHTSPYEVALRQHWECYER